ncbi:unnamed protein product [Ceratitis capitata]|uniref:(Mediterranean fruit fly) hypothetical protein n=1 Tax=Ceratitis capitata TaxID=7213 RepID=A0A811UR36_CERCA|nr:unnamed protein product [Ceratitis capitata]
MTFSAVFGAAKKRVGRSPVCQGQNAPGLKMLIYPCHTFLILFCFAHKKSEFNVMFDYYVGGLLPSWTIADWYSYYMATVVLYQIDQQTTGGKIGGPGKIVQIDETQFG